MGSGFESQVCHLTSYMNLKKKLSTSLIFIREIIIEFFVIKNFSVLSKIINVQYVAQLLIQ